jgi:hypothetical protein
VKDATTSPSAADLFHKWKQFFEAGTQTTAEFVAADDPGLIPRLQQLIDEYLSAREVDAASTLTGDPSAAKPPRPPEIPGYTVEAFLGGGGMGEVWRVRDQLDRVWALKLVRPDRLSSAGRERFLAEGRAMDRVRHPHIVHIHHYDFHDDVPFFLMKAYPASLRDRLSDYRTDPAAAVRLMAQVAEGVGHLHAHGFVHRDLKPGNVLIDEAGRPAVSDFGLVKSLADDSPPTDPAVPAAGSAETNPTGARRSRTVVGAVLGTRAYMSPEQAAGKTEQANPRWDVWSLGVMLHELLTGVLPRSSCDPGRLLDSNVPDNPPPTSQKPNLDARLDRIIRKCLARDEARRYPDATALASDLWAAGRGNSRWPLVVGGAVVLALGVGIGIMTITHRDPGLVPVPTLGPPLLPVDGEPIVLVPDVGPPAWHHVALGPPNAIQVDEVAHRQPLTLDTNRVLIVDLSADPKVDSYRLEAEVQSAGVANSLLGLYVGRQVVATPTGHFQTFLGLGFGVDGLTGRWELMVRSIEEVESGHHVHRDESAASGSFPLSGGTNTDWHHLAVEVSPAGYTWYFDRHQVASIPATPGPNDQQMFRRRLGVGPDRLLELAPRSPVGVFSLSGLGKFRNVKLTPTPHD